MNRFCKSTFSLLLATLLLFSAAGISFGMVLQSTHAYAVGPSVETPAPAPDEEDQQETSGQDEQEKPQETEQPEEQPPVWNPKDQTINIMGEEKKTEKKELIPEQAIPEKDKSDSALTINPPKSENNISAGEEEDSISDDNNDSPIIEGHVSAVLLNGIDLTENMIRIGEKGKLELALSLSGITLEQYESYQKTIKFSGRNFVPDEPIEPSFLSHTEQNGVLICTVSVEDVLYNGISDKIEFSLLFSDGSGSSISLDFSQTIRTEAASENYEIKSAIFTNSENNIISRITRGNYANLIVTIHDYGISASKFNSVKNKTSVSINTDVFRTSNASISNGTGLKGGGVSYDITFSDVYFSGKDNNLQLIIDYDDPDITKRRLVHTLSQCQIYEPEPDDNNNYPDDDDDHDSSSSKPDIPPPTPNIIVSTYDYGGGNVTAAGNFTLTMTLMNTSKRVNVDNVVMKLSVPEAFTLTSSSNTFYIERIAKRSSVERTVNLSVKPNADAISHPIKVSFTYESVINDERKQFSAEQDISIPVSQLDRFSLNPVEMPSEIYVGEDSSIEATFVNKGKSTVYNVTAEITGNLSQPGQRQFIGNVESGKEESADFLIGALEAGTISGEVVISYEDANMNVNELRSPFTTTAVSFEMPAPDPGLDVMNPDDIGEAPPEPWYQKIPVWGWTTGGVTAIILLSFAAKAMRRHRELKLLEDSDEDF